MHEYSVLCPHCKAWPLYPCRMMGPPYPAWAFFPVYEAHGKFLGVVNEAHEERRIASRVASRIASRVAIHD